MDAGDTVIDADVGGAGGRADVENEAKGTADALSDKKIALLYLPGVPSRGDAGVGEKQE